MVEFETVRAQIATALDQVKEGTMVTEAFTNITSILSAAMNTEVVS